MSDVMSDAAERRSRLQISAGVSDADLSWSQVKHNPYSYHVTMHHIPTGMDIEQASDCSYAAAKGYCLRELKWRLKNWDEYKKSTLSDTGDS